MPRVVVQPGPFDMATELRALTDGRTDVGGVGCFVGVVRAAAGERRLAALVLEHYPGMTQAMLASVAGQAEQRWRLLGCTVVHRVGRLVPGEAIVLVLAASRHRAPALEATGFLIDWLKVQAPFWKKEIYADGGEAWVEAREADTAAAERWG